MTYPPPDVRGLIVAGSDAPGPEWVFAQCPEFGLEIRAEVPDYSHKIIWKRRPKSTDEVVALARRNRAGFRAQAEAAERADARTDWSALMVHFHNLDGLQHRLWPDLHVDETGCRLGRVVTRRSSAASGPSTRRSAGSWSWPRSGTPRSSRCPTTASAPAGRWWT